jgi:hypothetical protein
MAGEEKQKAPDKKQSSPAMGRNLAIIGAGLVLLIAGVLTLRHYQKQKLESTIVPDAAPGPENHTYDSFAQCLATKHAKMYGLFWCPHCKDQKAEFGSSFQYVPYVECVTKEHPHELTPECKAAGVTLFPSWQFGADPPKEGVLSLQQLSEKSGCSLP